MLPETLRTSVYNLPFTLTEKPRPRMASLNSKPNLATLNLLKWILSLTPVFTLVRLAKLSSNNSLGLKKLLKSSSLQNLFIHVNRNLLNAIARELRTLICFGKIGETIIWL